MQENCGELKWAAIQFCLSCSGLCFNFFAWFELSFWIRNRESGIFFFLIYFLRCSFRGQCYSESSRQGKRQAEVKAEGKSQVGSKEGWSVPKKYQINPACIHPLPHLVLAFETQGQGAQNRLQMRFWMPMLSIRVESLGEVLIQGTFTGYFMKLIYGYPSRHKGMRPQLCLGHPGFPWARTPAQLMGWSPSTSHWAELSSSSCPAQQSPKPLLSLSHSITTFWGCWNVTFPSWSLLERRNISMQVCCPRSSSFFTPLSTLRSLRHLKPWNI